MSACVPVKQNIANHVDAFIIAPNPIAWHDLRSFNSANAQLTCPVSADCANTGLTHFRHELGHVLHSAARRRAERPAALLLELLNEILCCCQGAQQHERCSRRSHQDLSSGVNGCRHDVHLEDAA